MDGPLAIELYNIAEQLERNFLLNKELKEAIQAGVNAKSAVLKVYNELKQAKHWGQWDMAGRGRHAHFGKRHAIDKANQQKINHTINNVLKTRDEIESINRSLLQEQKKTEDSTIALHQKRDSILES